MMLHNAETVAAGTDERPDRRNWKDRPEGVVQLCAQLSGIMLIEAVASL